jgi:hypothetical protein
MSRLPHWEARLAALIAAHRDAPFAWGAFDCITFAGDAVVAVTGRDPLAGLRGHWHTALGAARLLRQRGGLMQAVLATLGDPLPHVRLAGPGDLVLTSREQALAVVHRSSALLPASRGLAHVSMGGWQMGWRVE